MNQLIKLLLLILLCLSLLKMPYLFYRFSSIAFFVGFGWLAYNAYQRRDQLDVKIYAVLTIIFNPFIVLPFPHFLWIIITILVIIGLVLNILFAEENPYDDINKKDGV